MIRLIGYIGFFVLSVVSAYWLWETQPVVRTFIQKNLQTGEFLTLEVRYSPEQIMELHRDELLKDEAHVFLKPSLTFYPYLLLEVKYVRDDHGTGEGVMLWGLEDGEMVVNTNTWEKTHGYEDCIISDANRNDFKIINTIAEHGGAMDRKSLLNALFIESDILDSWIEETKRKQLIIQRGNDYRLHFQNPKLQQIPETKMKHRLVSKPYKNAQRIPKNYSLSQIETVSKAAFGAGFAIRNVTEVYLPAYSIVVKNPDGSTLTTQWNAITGKRIEDQFYP